MNKKKIKLLFFSISPLIISVFFSFIIRLGFVGMELSILSFLFCIYWFFVGYKSYYYTESIKESILIGNSFGILSIILIVIQIGLVGRYFMNFIGILPTYYYLPIGRVSDWIENILYIFIKYTSNSMLNSLISFFIMMLLYYFGYKVSKDLNEF